MNPAHPTLLIVLTMAVVSGFVGYHAIHSFATSEEMQNYVNESAEWCEDHNGELVNSNVIGSHGGLHCEFNNGTSVHMNEVIKRGETA